MDEQKDNAITETICNKNRQAIHDCHDLASKWPTLWGGTTGDTEREFLGDTGRHEATGTKAGAEAAKKITSKLLFPLTWQCVPYSKRHSLPAIAGLYAVITKEQEIVYVGKSTNIAQRWRSSSHHVHRKIKNTHGIMISFINLDTDEERSTVEFRLISKYCPKLNGTNNALHHDEIHRNYLPDEYAESRISASRFAEIVQLNNNCVIWLIKAGAIKHALKVKGRISWTWTIPLDFTLRLQSELADVGKCSRKELASICMSLK